MENDTGILKWIFTTTQLKMFYLFVFNIKAIFCFNSYPLLNFLLSIHTSNMLSLNIHLGMVSKPLLTSGNFV